MGKLLKSTLVKLFSSKKFLAALFAAAAWIAGRIGFDLDPVTLGGAITPLITYIIAQGSADKGKEAALIGTESDQRIAKAQIDAGSGDPDERKKASDSLAPPVAG